MKKLVLLAVILVFGQCHERANAQNYRIVDDLSSVRDSTLVCTRVYTLNGPIGKHPELIGFAPIPPSITGQKDATLKVEVIGAAQFETTVVKELSAQHRLFNKLVIHPDQAGSPITVRWIYNAKLTSRKAVPSKSRLTSSEIVQPYVTNPNPALIDITSNELKAFAERCGLIRSPHEAPAEFEWRSLRTLPRQLTYVHKDDQNLKASYLTKLPSPIPTDCGGYALLSVAISTVNNISSDVRMGRWVIPKTNETGPHVQYQFYDPYTKDYWIVDPTCSRDQPESALPNFFGNWQNNFLTTMLGTDALVDTVRFGVQSIPWGSPAVWISDCYYGFGDTEKWTASSSPVPEPKSNAQQIDNR